MKRGVFVQRIRLGKRVLKAEINTERCLALMLEACEKAADPETDKAQTAAELFAGIFGVETAQELLDFYGGQTGEAAERLMPLLLGKILKRSVRAEIRRQKQRARLYSC